MSGNEIIFFNSITDSRGNLIVLEEQKNVPFDIKRIYYMYGCDKDVERGYHAHHTLTQLAICVSGSCSIRMDNGFDKYKVKLDSPNMGLMINPLEWHEMYEFSNDCVLMVLADDYYDESDYIRDYQDFKAIVRS